MIVSTRLSSSPLIEPARSRNTGEKMKISYDPEVDVLSVLFNDNPIEESDEERPGLILDFDADGNVVGLEVLNASMRVDNPLEYAAHS
jgi:uncharacterized protein YuzE